MQVTKEVAPVRAIRCPESSVARSGRPLRQSTGVHQCDSNQGGGAGKRSQQAVGGQGEGVRKRVAS